MAEILHARRRDELGTTACRRLRRQGIVPAVLYGHGLENVPLAIPEAELNAAIRHGGKLVEVTGDVADNALLRDVQWDALGVEVLHVDLTRVSADETVEVEISVELRGEAPGGNQGGIVEHLLHSVEIRCKAAAIPEHLIVSLNHLNLNDVVTAGDLQLPEDATLVTDPDGVIVQCVPPAAEEEEAVETAEAAEPEVIRRPGDEGDGGEA